MEKQVAITEMLKGKSMTTGVNDSLRFFYDEEEDSFKSRNTRNGVVEYVNINLYPKSGWKEFTNYVYVAISIRGYVFYIQEYKIDDLMVSTLCGDYKLDVENLVNAADVISDENGILLQIPDSPISFPLDVKTGINVTINDSVEFDVRGEIFKEVL